MQITNTKHELTMQEAANFLNVSHPFVIKEIEANRQRRIEFEELRRYQAEQQRKSERTLQNLTKTWKNWFGLKLKLIHE